MSELRLPNVRISQRNLGEYPDVEVDGVPINGVTEFEFKPPHRLTLVLEVGHLEALREPLRPGPRGTSATDQVPVSEKGSDLKWLAIVSDESSCDSGDLDGVVYKLLLMTRVTRDRMCARRDDGSPVLPEVKEIVENINRPLKVVPWTPHEPANVPYVGDGWSGLRKGVVEGLEGTGQFERGSVTAEKVTGDVNAALEKASRQAEETVLVSWTGRGPDGEVLF